MPMKSFTCEQCGTPFQSRHCKNGILPKFCSSRCYHLSTRRPISPQGTYVCSRCKKEKPVSEFGKRSARSVGISAHCKECHNRDHYDINVWRERRLVRLYKTDPDTYDKLYKSQEGKCALCGCDDGSNGKGRLALDHNHQTYEVRGLLCFKCNTTIGSVEKVGLDKITQYLARS